MTPNLSCYLILACAFAMSGCFQDFKYRDCSAFNHPVLEQWQPLKQGSTTVFTDAAGNSAIYVLKSITNSEPYQAALDVNSSALDGPICRMTSTHVFVADDQSHEISVEIIQTDTDGVDPELDPLQYRLIVRVSEPGTDEPGRIITGTLDLNLMLPEDVVDYGTLRTQYFANRTFENGQSYSDVIEFSGNGSGSAPEYLSITVNGFSIARNAGLIQLKRADGAVYTVVAD